MPDPNLSEALKEAMASAPVDTVILECVSLEHPSLTAPTHLVRDTVGHTFTLEDGSTADFLPVPFRLRLPDKGSRVLDLTLEIDNIERQGTDFVLGLRGSPERVVVTYRLYLADDPTTPQLDPPWELYLTDVTVDAIAVRGRASVADLVNRAVPQIYYTDERFPGLSPA